ncbi:hypothetical protein [Salibacterium halotolerans]|uniref:Uncharacterized protein n=1 Tax=Salibacterium halotolerans TaxID=1884432 RepID=A0A1I5V7W7_9BACI|nr:hypothetical protein [Salibacterium halotolerans]SFQ03530.1 hypothetical protein SAMN05518683_11564 [Salibacterium halotolerans]
MNVENQQGFLETFQDEGLRRQLEDMLHAAYRKGYNDGYKAKLEELE